MRTSVESLEGNKIKLTVEVDEEEVKRAEEDTLKRLTREAQLPGFRPGKVPRRLLVARLGPKAIREEVLRDALPHYYEHAIEEESLDIIAQPDIDITAGEEAGPIVFDATVEVRPQVSIIGYQGLEITVPSPTASDEDVDSQIDRLRQQFATLNEVARAASNGDIVTLDIHGSRDGEAAEGLTADDLVYEVGSGGIVDGIDEKLVGAAVGDTFELDADDAPDGPAHLDVAVKLVREKVLPDADDAFAADASEFETLAQLREDLRDRLSSVKRLQTSMAIRERAIEALVELVQDDAPAPLVDEEKEHLLQDLAYRLSQQRVTIQEYLSQTGQDPERLVADLEPQAIRQVKADLALRALALAESIEAEESDVDDEIVRLAAQGGQSPADLRSALDRSGRLSGLRSQIRNAKAMKWLVEHVAVVDEQGNPMDRAELEAVLGDQHDHVHEHSDEHETDSEEA